jgi:predicted nucleic acid-binding protein
MNVVLVDTSVWVEHFRQSQPALVNLLMMDSVLVHPLVIGEIACGTPPNRTQTLADLDNLPNVKQASFAEVLSFIEREALYGLGCGLVDISLLASTMLTSGAQLWTLDKRLSALAQRFEVLYQPAH